jgi:ubiquinone/menaquinone biosynthesis C-methylase UbiE
MNDLPFFKVYKSLSRQLLEIKLGQFVFACGTSANLIHLASRYPGTKFIGVDKSESFLSIGRERSKGLTNLQFLPADAQSLPLGDHSVHGIRIDRSLQGWTHGANPLSSCAMIDCVTLP